MASRKRIRKKVPTTDQVLRVPLTEEGTACLRAKANRTGCSPGQLVRQGIDWITDLTGESPARAFKQVRKPSSLCREVWPDRSLFSAGHAVEKENGSRKKRPPSAVALRPARMAGLMEAARSIAAAAGGEAGSPSLWQGDLTGQGRAARSTDPGTGGTGLNADWPALVTRLVQEAARWAAESLRAPDVRTGGPSSRQAGQLFEKPSGGERGGRRVQVSITREAKERISERARRQFGWCASKLARLAVHDLIEHIERRPVEALRYIRAERDYYQPPNRGRKSRYSYQIAVGLETRKLLKYAPLVLRQVLEDYIYKGYNSEEEGSEEGRSSLQGLVDIERRKLTQKRVLQAAGRRAIESEDIGFPPLELGGLV